MVDLFIHSFPTHSLINSIISKNIADEYSGRFSGAITTLPSVTSAGAASSLTAAGFGSIDNKFSLPSVAHMRLEQEVQANIVLRESYVQRLREMEVASVGGGLDLHAVSDLMLLLRTATVEVAEAIIRWRGNGKVGG